MPSALLLSCLIATATGVEVSGQIEMPELCTTSVSPAVVVLEPREGSGPQPSAPANVSGLVIGQRGLQFEPRVSAITLGRPLRFTNADPETHSVHIQGNGTTFSQSIAPGRQQEYLPTRPGLYAVLCDVHSHMRAYVVVARSPWIKTCGRDGGFRFRDVPPGSYALQVWHEGGEGLKVEREIRVEGSALDVGKVAVTGRPRTVAVVAGVARPWPDVIDRISVLLSASIKAAGQPGGLKKARTLAQDAYFDAFETSEMETAVGRILGTRRLHALEMQFRDFYGPRIGEIANQSRSASDGVALQRALLIDLARAAHDLDAQGITDASHLHAAALPVAAGTTASGLTGKNERAAHLATLDSALGEVRKLADAGQAEDAASELVRGYDEGFQPIEDDLKILVPGVVLPLESRFNTLRGLVNLGLKGDDLDRSLTELRSDIGREVGQMDAASTGGFTPAFLASLGIILREGVEVILLLGMLFALVSKVGHPGALRSIRWGVGLAVLASILTAIALNRMLAATQGRTRELMEGVVMLAATAVLFYVSYWLISQSESKRWTEFLKRQARRGAEVGGFGTLGLTAFLAVYREGAETALMYQAQVVIFGSTRQGWIGLVAGLALGFLLLAVLYKVLRSASVRLPMRPFFKVTGVILFAMAVIFAGKGVAELQACGFLRVTPLGWLGQGLPALGVYPNTQALSIQGLLLAGAGVAFAMLTFGGDRPPKKTTSVGATKATSARAGA